MKRALILTPVLLAASALAGWGALQLYSRTSAASAATFEIPATAVKRGDIAFIVYAKGELQGGKTEVLSAPQVGGQALAITFLRASGELVKEGDTVVKFDTTDQEFNLHEAEADLAEAEQQVIQAQAESVAKQEEAESALVQARSDLKVAELEARKNPVLPGITAKQNDLAVAAARDKVGQLERDLDERLRAAKAGIAIQEAARQKAKVAAEMARRNIEAMTLKAKSSGYVALAQNQDGNWRWGSYLPAFQVGDTVRAGVPVAQIPDMNDWEVSAQIGELDRAHLGASQPADIEVIALPGRKFKGAIKSIGGTTGPPWDRRFECRITLQQTAPELRPGMSTRLRIVTETKRGALWVPTQALFDADGRKFVYAKSVAGFTPKDVKLVRRSESQAVIEGLAEGQLVALANPDQMKKQPAGKAGSALQAIPR